MNGQELYELFVEVNRRRGRPNALWLSLAEPCRQEWDHFAIHLAATRKFGKEELRDEGSVHGAQEHSKYDEPGQHVAVELNKDPYYRYQAPGLQAAEAHAALEKRDD